MGKKSLFADSENFRSKQEGKQLCDLGLSLLEKYGPETGWKLGLRSDWKDRERVKAGVGPARATSQYSDHAEEPKIDQEIPCQYK